MGCDDSDGPGHAPRYLDVSQMLKIIPLVLLVSLIIGCSDNAERGSMNKPEDNVDQEIVEEGMVSNSKHPQINGIGCWGLEDYRGRKVRVRGTIKKIVVTEEMINPKNGDIVAHEGAGVFYELVQLRDISIVE